VTEEGVQGLRGSGIKEAREMRDHRRLRAFDLSNPEFLNPLTP